MIQKWFASALLGGLVLTAHPAWATGPSPDPRVTEAAATVTPPYDVPWPYQYVDVRIFRSLETTLVKATGQPVGPRLTQVVKRVLVWWIDVRRQLHPNDRLELVYEVPKEGEPVVHAVWFHSQQLGKMKVAVRYQAKDQPFARWYAPDGKEIELRLKNSPIQTYEQITSLLKDGRGHRGVDFKAPEGTMIKAPFSGVVLRRNWSTRRNGLCLAIEDPKTKTQAYLLHLSSIVRGIKPGIRVKVGQPVARSGNTGRSTAPHLHYQLEKNRRIIDPLRYHKTWRARLPAEERGDLAAALARFARLRSGAS